MDTVFDTHYYRVTKMLCSLVGLWPYQPQHKRRIMQLFQAFMLYFTCIPPLMTRICQSWDDLDTMSMCLPPILVLIVYTIKIVTIDRFELEIKTVLRQIETEWEITSRKEEYEILVRHTRTSKKLCILYTAISFKILSCFIVIPTFSPILDIILPQNETRVRNLAFDLDYGIDQQHYWFWLWLHSSTMAAIGTSNVVAADLLYITITIHSSCLFAITRHKLEHMVEKNTAKFFKNINHDEEYDAYRHDGNIQHKLKKQALVIRECVISHRKAIEYAHLLHRIYIWNFFVIMALNVICISIAAVQLVSKLFHWADMTLSIMSIVSALIHLYFLTIMAQKILDESMKIHESILSSYWYNMPIQLWKDVVLILTRSRIPSKLTAGKMIVISLENFSSVLQTAMSYFTLLLSFR